MVFLEALVHLSKIILFKISASLFLIGLFVSSFEFIVLTLMVLGDNLNIKSLLVGDEKFLEDCVDFVNSDFFERLLEHLWDILDSHRLLVEILSLHIDPVLSGLSSETLSLSANTLDLLSLVSFDSLSSEWTFNFSHLIDECINSLFKVFWSMAVRLDDEHCTDDFVHAIELTLNDVTELLLVSKLVKGWLVDQTHQNLECG